MRLKANEVPTLILPLHHSGLTYIAIAKELQKDRATILYHFKKMHITPNNYHARPLLEKPERSPKKIRTFESLNNLFTSMREGASVKALYIPIKKLCDHSTNACDCINPGLMKYSAYIERKEHKKKLHDKFI